LPGVDQRAIEIKDQQAQLAYGNLTIDLHALSVSAPIESVGMRSTQSSKEADRTDHSPL
jgi:hypothetical protein